MIKATISNEPMRNTFAKAKAKKIAGGTFDTKINCRGVILDNYKLIASGTCSEKKNSFDLNNILLFNKQKEVA